MQVFTMFRGDDRSYEITVLDKDTGTPVNITGCVLVMTWKEKITDTNYFLQKEFGLTDPQQGKAIVDIDAADTSGLATERKQFFFDVELTNISTGRKQTLISGKIVVEPDVTT